MQEGLSDVCEGYAREIAVETICNIGISVEKYACVCEEYVILLTNI